MYLYAESTVISEFPRHPSYYNSAQLLWRSVCCSPKIKVHVENIIFDFFFFYRPVSTIMEYSYGNTVERMKRIRWPSIGQSNGTYNNNNNNGDIGCPNTIGCERTRRSGNERDLLSNSFTQTPAPLLYIYIYIRLHNIISTRSYNNNSIISDLYIYNIILLHALYNIIIMIIIVVIMTIANRIFGRDIIPTGIGYWPPWHSHTIITGTNTIISVPRFCIIRIVFVLPLQVRLQKSVRCNPGPPSSPLSRTRVSSSPSSCPLPPS